MKAILLLTILNLSLYSAANSSECNMAISTQATDILGLELDLSYEEVEQNFKGLDKLNLMSKKGDIEYYKIIASSNKATYKLTLNVNYVCDVTSYEVLNVKQCVNTCQSFSDGVQDYKRCVKSCY